jgi:hypothetical protein
MDVMNQRASLWSKVGSIFTNDLHYLTCASDLFVKCPTWLSHHLNPITDLFHTFLFPMQGAKEHASLSSPSFALLYTIIISSWVYLEVHNFICIDFFGSHFCFFAFCFTLMLVTLFLFIVFFNVLFQFSYSM